MTKKQKQQHLAEIKAALTSDQFASLLNGAKLNDQMDGFSIRGDRNKLREIEKTITPLTRHENKAVSATAKNLIKKSKAKAKKGMFGDGVFLID